jgi:hypothetical protein
MTAGCGVSFSCRSSNGGSADFDNAPNSPKLSNSLAGEGAGLERLDRLARSIRQLLTTVDTLAARGIGPPISLHENIDTTSATGRLVFHIFAALWQFEVELLREITQPLWRPAAPVATLVVAPGIGCHQGHSGESNASIRHHDRLRGCPTGRVQHQNAWAVTAQ